MFKQFRSKLTGFLVGLAAVSGLAIAANTFYAGYTLETNQYGIPGLEVFGGIVPTITGSTGCGTLGTIKGGTSHGEFTIGTFATSCTLTLALPTNTGLAISTGLPGVAVPNRVFCTFRDLTTPTDSITVASATTTGCVSGAATVATGDVIQYSVSGY